MNAFQIIFAAFCALQACLALTRFRRLRRWIDLAFLAVWATGFILVLIPHTTLAAAALLGIHRGTDLVLYVLSFAFLWAHYQHYIRYKQLEEHVTVLVRELAVASALRQDTT